MSELEFDTLVTLIELLINAHAAGDGHRSDAPRQATLARDKEQAIELARSILVL